jgi:hypothetical protein
MDEMTVLSDATILPGMYGSESACIQKCHISLELFKRLLPTRRSRSNFPAGRLDACPLETYTLFEGAP